MVRSLSSPVVSGVPLGAGSLGLGMLEELKPDITSCEG